MVVGRCLPRWLLAAAILAFSQSVVAAPKPRDVAPAHLGTTLDGKPVLVTDFPGKVIIVSYWATWCPFCIKELGMLSAIQSAGNDRVAVVSVNIESVHVFRNVAKKLSQFELNLLYDPGRKGQRAYGVNGVPHMVIIGRDGLIDTVHIGYTERELDGIVTSINRAIGAIPRD